MEGRDIERERAMARRRQSKQSQDGLSDQIMKSAFGGMVGILVWRKAFWSDSSDTDGGNVMDVADECTVTKVFLFCASCSCFARSTQ